MTPTWRHWTEITPATVWRAEEICGPYAKPIRTEDHTFHCSTSGIERRLTEWLRQGSGIGQVWALAVALVIAKGQPLDGLLTWVKADVHVGLDDKGLLTVTVTLPKETTT